VLVVATVYQTVAVQGTTMASQDRPDEPDLGESDVALGEGGEETAPRTLHDAFFKDVFSDPRRAASELAAILPARVAQHIDWSSLSLAHASAIGQNFEQRHGDLFFQARLRDGREAYLWLLFEHQSTVDRWMALRITEMVLAFWKRWRRHKATAERVPAVVPVVLYHGAQPWNAATSLSGLMDLSEEAGQDFAGLVLSGGFALDDMRAVSDEELATRAVEPYAKLALVVFKYGPALELPMILGRYRDTMMEVLGDRDGEELLQEVLTYAWHVNHHYEDVDTFLRHLQPTTSEIANAMPSLYQHIEQRGRQKGLEQGLEQGQRQLLLRQLEQRFGPLSAEVRTRVGQAHSAELLAWAERVLDARSLDDIFSV